MYTKGSKKHPYLKPIFIYPQLISPDEIFVPISQSIVPYCLPYYIISNYGRIYNIYENKFMSTHTDAYGYQVITFFLHNEPEGRKTKSIKLHRLVMLHFHYFEGCENYQVNHKDTIKSHNYDTNLEWCTQLENIRHARSNGLIHDTKGENKSNALITDDEARIICQKLQDNIPATAISKEMNISVNIIYNIKQRRNWMHIVKDYSW